MTVKEWGLVVGQLIGRAAVCQPGLSLGHASRSWGSSLLLFNGDKGTSMGLETAV